MDTMTKTKEQRLEAVKELLCGMTDAEIDQVANFASGMQAQRELMKQQQTADWNE